MPNPEHRKFVWLVTKYVVVSVVAIIAFIFACMAGYPVYNVWSQEMSGKAQLAEAEWNRQIKVQEAQAARDSSIMLAEAEVERAKGVARANEIIGDSLKGNDAYLRYLWIQSLNTGTSNVIYVPTEANLPILEASRLKD